MSGFNQFNDEPQIKEKPKKKQTKKNPIVQRLGVVPDKYYEKELEECERKLKVLEECEKNLKNAQAEAKKYEKLAESREHIKNSQVTYYQDITERKNKKIKEEGEKNTELENKNKDLNTKIENLKQTHKNEINKKKQEIEKNKQKQFEIKQDYDDKEKEKNQKIDEVNEEYQRIDAMNIEYSIKIGDLEDKYDKVIDQYLIKQHDIEKLNKKIITIENKNKKNKIDIANINSLEKELNEKNDILMNNEIKIKELEEQMDSVDLYYKNESEKSEAKFKKEYNIHKMNYSDELYATYKKEINDIENKHNDLAEKYNNAINDTSQDKKKIQDLNDKLENLESKANKSAIDIKNIELLESDLRQKDAILNNNENKIELLHRQMDRIEAEYTEKEKQLDMISAEYNNDNVKNTNKENELNQREMDLNAREEELKNIDKNKEITTLKTITTKEVNKVNKQYDEVIDNLPNTIEGDKIAETLIEEKKDMIDNITTEAEKKVKDIDSDKTIIVNRDKGKSKDGQDQIIVNVYNLCGGGGGGQPIYTQQQQPIYTQQQQKPVYTQQQPNTNIKSIAKKFPSVITTTKNQPLDMEQVAERKKALFAEGYNIAMSNSELEDYIENNNLIEDFDLLEGADKTRALLNFRQDQALLSIKVDPRKKKATKNKLEGFFSRKLQDADELLAKRDLERLLNADEIEMLKKNEESDEESKE